jgi:hypothetical protein
MKISDSDKGYKQLCDRVFGAAKTKPSIDVGILDDGPHGNDDMVSILQIAVWAEFGTQTEPARSFIRDWFDQNEAGLRKDLVILMQSVVQGKRTKEQILELLGQRCVAQIQERIVAGIDPPNAQSTIDRKGSSTPLIDTGILKAAVNYRVNP